MRLFISVTAKDGGSMFELYPGLIIDILNFAHELRLFTILPTVYLAICQGAMMPDVLFHGVRRPDGSMAELSLQAKLTCASGSILLQQAEKQKSFKWMTELPVPSCMLTKAESRCARGGRHIFYDQFYDAAKLTYGFEPWRASWGDLLCKSCRKMSEAKHETGRYELWKFVPTAFGFGDWESLVNFV